MGLLDLFRKQAPPAEAKAVTLTPQVMRFFDMLDQPTLPAGLTPFNAYATYALAYACMNFRAVKTVEPRLWLARETEDGDEWLEDHELGVLLEQPNPDMDMADLLELTSLYLDATGACVWLKNRDAAGRVGSLYPFSETEFTVKQAQDRLYGEFHITTSGGALRVPASEVVYFRRTDPRDLHNGLAPLDAALAHVNIGNEMRKAITANMRNAIRPGARLSVKGDSALTDAEVERLKATLATDYQGALNNGKVIFTERATLELLEASLKNLELGPMQQDVEAAICQCFTIHPGLVGAKLGIENAGGLSDSIGPALDLYYDTAQKPIWRRIERTLTRQLLREVDDDPNVRIKFDLSQIDALADDIGLRATEASTAGKFWTVNEGRIHTGQEPLEDTDERGEQFIEQPPVMVDPNADPDEDAEGDPDTDAGKQAKALDEVMVHRLVENATRETEESMLELLTHDQLMKDEVDWHQAIGLHRKDHEDDPITEAVAKQLIEAATEALERARGRWELAMRPSLETVAKRATAKAAAALGVRFDLLQPGLLEYVEREAAFLITSVHDTTKDHVRRAIRDGLESGDGIRNIAKRVADAGAFSRDRAKLIATTEVTRTRNGAALERMQAYAERTGLTVTKTWVNSADERVRKAHKDQPVGVGGESRPVDKPFSNGLQGPSEPNCRCSTFYNVE